MGLLRGGVVKSWGEYRVQCLVDQSCSEYRVLCGVDQSWG